MLKNVGLEELREIIENRESDERLDLSNCLFAKMDLSGWDLHNINFDKSDFRSVNLDGANMQDCSAENAFFQGSTLRGTNLKNAFLHTADFRFCKMNDVNICGADIYCAALHAADLTGIKADENTKFFFPRCPMEGAFIGWKVCFGRRIVQLLVPKDARRLQGTSEEVRVDKAKVLSIKSEDYTQVYHDAHSYVDENFVYTVGEMAEVEYYETERFTESGGGIHLWMDREAAIAYLG